MEKKREAVNFYSELETSWGDFKGDKINYLISETKVIEIIS